MDYKRVPFSARDSSSDKFIKSFVRMQFLHVSPTVTEYNVN